MASRLLIGTILESANTVEILVYVGEHPRCRKSDIYRNITFTDVSEHFSMSETQLKKLFREVTGYSVMQYYRKSVVDRIEYHIRQMDKNFTELSELFHFSSIHYFSKFYKRETGHTLREYQKNSQKS